MSWLSIDYADLPEYQEKLKALVQPQEISSMDAVSLLMRTHKSSKPIVAHMDGKAIDAALFFTDYGRITPVLGNDFLFHQEDVGHISKLAGSAVLLPTSVSGKAKAVDMFLDRFSCGQRQRMIEHFIMELFPGRLVTPQVQGHSKIKIAQGTIRQLLPLLPLQRTYEKQEVLLDPATIDTLETFRWLKSILTKEICFYAKCGFRYVSKANTNAWGFDHIQIGGVFTVRQFRGRGYAFHTVAALCRWIIEKEHRIPSLFVRTDNEKAIKLYKSLGFEIRDTTKTVYLD